MSILDDILRHKKQEVRKQQRQAPISRLFERLQNQDEPRNFAASLGRADTVALIAEVKKASPSAGVIREDFAAVALAQDYEKGGARAISVLTDEKYFQGKLAYLTNIRANVDLPVLRKDFIIDPYQIVEARSAGADAVLLIVSALSRGQMTELIAAAKEVRLDCLIEVHTFREVERVLSDDISLVGINNRDLETFTVDLRTTEKLIAIIPEEVIVVSESGIKDRADLERLSHAGIDAVLIGETLMREEDVEKTARKFTGVIKCPE